METSDLTARQIYQQIKDNPSRARFGFGQKAILVNVDPQKAYTRPDLFKTAYETDPKQLDYVNQLATAFRALDWPVVWTYVAFMESGEDCGVGVPAPTRRTHCRTSSLGPSVPSLMIA